MNNLYLEILLNLEDTIGWLDNVMFTFFTTLLNFSVEYNIEKKQLSDFLPFVVFTDTQDHMLKMNPCIRTNTFKLLMSEFSDLKKDNKDITKGINEWYHTWTSSNIDWILSVFQENKKIVPMLLFLYTMIIMLSCLLSFFLHIKDKMAK